MRALALTLALLAGAGCSDGDGDGDVDGDDTSDPGSEPAETGDTGSAQPELCLDAPVTTYANFGRGFLTQHCQACHASTTLDRHDAPTEVTFDTEELAWQWADRILARAAGPEPTMPPQGGVTEDDRYRLEVWLTCGG